MRSTLLTILICLTLVVHYASLARAAVKSPVASEDAFLMDMLWDHYRSLPEKHPLKVGLALGGGGARGLAHIGVLKALEEEHVPIDMIAGTSVGALIGSLYAAGVSTAEMEEMSQEIGWSSLTNFSRLALFRLVLVEHPLSSSNMQTYLEKHMGQIRFDQLKIPFECVATDLQTGERVVFREGPVAPAARASATIPGLFEPVVFRHRYLVDGGLVDNIPTDLVAAMGADVIIAVDVTADLSHFQPTGILSTLNQAIYIQSESVSKEELANVNVVIRPDLGDINATDLTRSEECVDGGVLATRRVMLDIKKQIIDRNLDRLMGKTMPPS